MKLWPSLFQSLVVFVSTLVVYVAIDRPPLATYLPIQDPDKKAVAAAAVSLVVAVLYWIGLLIGSIKPIRRLVDKDKARFLGQFVSIHQGGDTIGIFDIRFAVLSQKYSLHGDTYSRDPPSHVGYWNSSSLEIDKEILRYVYTGSMHGMCKIEFNNEISKGSGHFMEDVNPPRRSESAYTRLNRERITALLPGVFNWKLRDETDRLTFIRALHTLSTADPKKYGELFKLR
jgi:hypothetical protein